MRIRSAFATVLLTAALAAGGAATAAAHDGPMHGDEDATCSPYFGKIDSDTGDLAFGGINCRSDDYDSDDNE
ncbi:hypothetical protein ACGFZL_00465 [Streptomyces sp. NPDC048182]|uniref:hypothetical protein n=1 Tax=unclassified Streptomyces TaxID=2593676 RepID=UPI0033BCDEC9